jgi:hypothetical protein
MEEEKTKEELFLKNQLKTPIAPNRYNIDALKKAYNSLTWEEKMLLEEKEQTMYIGSIKTNVRFFTWLTVWGMIVYAFFLFYYYRELMH